MTDDAATDAEDAGLDASDRRAAVRDRYGAIATESPADSCCDTSCCGDATDGARRRGYSDEDVAAVDPDAYLGLGCGNPTAIASLDRGDDVLDLGSGGGFDCFLAAREVGSDGRVVGVDMTPEMVERARENAETNDASNVEFRLGEIEHLPVPDESVDVILSNCVVNLSPDKPQVFREAYRVLRPGGRLAISDVVLTAPLPDGLATDPDSVASCVGGASTVAELETMLTDAGFVDVRIEPDDDSEAFIREWDDERDPSDYVLAASIEGTRPDAAR
ncbi:arsenite methyltransferase [Halosimplex amylolyticum]|uniref:arsenite methyltransferase n=1 Tax=Halosimplex amylolyticum TaxID=3396616 RepID=UPI003F55E06B